jgi:SAM-dependent methyltransferase
VKRLKKIRTQLSRDAWQASMYDASFAARTIASREYERYARAEVRFLVGVLGLKKGESLLDAPCGTGRHARFFAQRGLKVTGIDLNPGLIRIARGLDRRSRYLKGDLLELARPKSPYRGEFDVVVNLFTSFGYFASEAKNRAVLRGLVRSLKSGGRLAINLIDRDWLLRNFEATSHSVRDGVETLETRNYDARTHAIEAHTTVADLRKGTRRAYFHRTRLYSKSEMVKLMRAAGLTRIKVYGDSAGQKFERYETSHPTYVGWKE